MICFWVKDLVDELSMNEFYLWVKCPRCIVGRNVDESTSSL